MHFNSLGERTQELQLRALISGDPADFTAFLRSHLGDHWSDPVEVVGSAIGFLNGIVNLPFDELINLFLFL
jgi:hypothetical protein